MSTRTVSQAFSNSTDANFRLWGKWISDGFAAFGWAQASDTGQINWATVLAPTAATTFMGFEIWKMGDTLQATYPLFVKVEYGSGADATGPSIAITYGTGSDGAGNLTGVIAARAVFVSTSVTTAVTCYASGAPNRFNISMARGVTKALVWAIERTHDATGADSNIGIMLFNGVAATWSGRQANFTGLQPPSTFTQINYSPTPPTGSGALSPDIHLFPVRCWTPGESTPSHNLCACVATDFTEDAAVAVVGYDGVTRTYRVMSTDYPPALGSSYQSTRALLRYD